MINKITLAVLCLIVVSGCAPRSTDSPAGGATNTSDTPVPSSTEDQTAAGQADEIQLAIDSTPELVCEYFIGHLQRENLTKAERCLTQEAMTHIRACELELSAPGGPNAVYRFQPPKFASAKQTVAFVPCVVVDNGQTDEFSLMLKHGEFGWKIAGMLLPDEHQSADLFSFENPVDVAKIKSMIGESDASIEHRVEHVAQRDEPTR
jgi:hypothetical protein